MGLNVEKGTPVGGRSTFSVMSFEKLYGVVTLAGAMTKSSHIARGDFMKLTYIRMGPRGGVNAADS